MVVLLVAGEAGEAGGVEPVEIVGEPFLEGGEIGFGEGFGVGEEGNRLGNFGEMYGFDEAFGAAGVRRWDDLGILEAGSHVGCGIDEPCMEMSDCLFGVFVVFGEDEGRSERGDVKAQVEEGIAMGGEGFGVGWAGALSVWAIWRGRVGPVVFGLGVEVVRSSWAALCGKCGEWGCWLREVACCRGDDAVVIDGCYVGTRGGFGGWLWGLSRESAGEEECGG